MPSLLNCKKYSIYILLLLKPFHATFVQVLTVYNGAPINMEHVFRQYLYLWFTEPDMGPI